MHKILRSKRPHCKILLKCCNYKKVYPRLTPSLGKELNSRTAKYYKWNKTWHTSMWFLWKRTLSIFQFKGFWPQHLPLSQQITTTMSRDEGGRKETFLTFEKGFFSLYCNIRPLMTFKDRYSLIQQLEPIIRLNLLQSS